MSLLYVFAVFQYGNMKQKKAFQVLMIAKKNVKENILTLVSIKIGQCFHTNGKNMNKHTDFFFV